MAKFNPTLLAQMKNTGAKSTKALNGYTPYVAPTTPTSEVTPDVVPGASSEVVKDETVKPPADIYNLADADTRTKGLLDEQLAGYNAQLSELNRMGNVSQMRAAGVANQAGGTALGGLAQAAATQGNIEAGGLRQDAYQKYLGAKMGIMGANANLHQNANTAIGTDTIGDQNNEALWSRQDIVDNRNRTWDLQDNAIELAGGAAEADKIMLADANAAYDTGGFMRPAEVASNFSPELASMATSLGVGASADTINKQMIKYQQDTGRPMTQAQVYQWIMDEVAKRDPQALKEWKQRNAPLLMALQSESSKKKKKKAAAPIEDRGTSMSSFMDNFTLPSTNQV